MKRLISVAALLLAFVVAPIAATSTWNPIALKVQKSISYLEGAEGSCTAWSINEAKDYVMTAAHCDMSNNTKDDFLVDNIPAKVVAKDAKKDLLVLEVKGINKPALHLAKSDPLIGDEIASYGYGLGLERPLFRVTHVSDTDLHINQDGLGGPYIVTDTDFIGGQSGGPVVNSDGDVVMIVQMGVKGLGIGVGAETIKSKMGRYFETPK